MQLSKDTGCIIAIASVDRAGLLGNNPAPRVRVFAEIGLCDAYDAVIRKVDGEVLPPGRQSPGSYNCMDGCTRRGAL
jgi:hypothetical protein